MISMRRDVLNNIMKNKRYDIIQEAVDIIHPNQKPVTVYEYAGSDVRMINDDKTIRIMCPKDMTPVQENAVTDAIESGAIFDDSETINNTAEYIERTAVPVNAMNNKGYDEPKQMKIVLTGILNKMDEDDCHFKTTDGGIESAHNFIKDIVCCDHKDDQKILHILYHHLGEDEFNSFHPHMRGDLMKLRDEIEAIQDISPEDYVTDDDYEFECDLPVQEGFLSKKPKKLKPLPRSIIAYITTEMNAIQDSNDQAMLSGYTCAKLEMVDFYLNVIDTQDERYIVPHTRQYLVTMQNELNQLLIQILRIKPINRNDRVWQINVNYPEGWRG